MGQFPVTTLYMVLKVNLYFSDVFWQITILGFFQTLLKSDTFGVILLYD